MELLKLLTYLFKIQKLYFYGTQNLVFAKLKYFFSKVFTYRHLGKILAQTLHLSYCWNLILIMTGGREVETWYWRPRGWKADNCWEHVYNLGAKLKCDSSTVATVVYNTVYSIVRLVDLLRHQMYTIHSWAGNKLFTFATTTTRQRNSASGTREKLKNVKVSVSKWSSHNENSNNAITNNCEAWKHGHVVAALLLRAQLCK